MSKFKSLANNFIIFIKTTVTKKKIKKYGYTYVLLLVLIKLCHRSNSKFEHILTQKKDKKIDTYLNNNYSLIIRSFFSENEKK